MVESILKPQKDFPFLEEFKKKFPITDGTIFACSPYIYANYPLRQDILIHELVHFKQQDRDGLTNWVYDFLEYPDKRLEYELEAYKEQLKSIKDRNQRTKIRFECAQNLSSPLYGNIITYEDALKQLK